MEEQRPLNGSLDYIQFQFTTIFGTLRAVEFPALLWGEMYGGTGVDRSSLGFLRTEQSDMKVVPYPGSLQSYDTYSYLRRSTMDDLQAMEHQSNKEAERLGESEARAWEIRRYLERS